MTVPTTGSFLMFGTGSNTTIAGAIIEGGANAGTVSSTLNFNALKALANINKFDAEFKEGATTLSEIVKTTQFRGYPIVGTTTTTLPPTTTTTLAPTTTTTTAAPTTTTTTAAATTTTTLAPCSLTIFFDVSVSPGPAGFTTSANACAGTGTSLTIFTVASPTCPTTFQEIFNDGKAMFLNAALTTPLAGNDEFYKSVSAPNNGIAIQVDNNGFITTLSSPCNPSSTTTTTTTAAPTTTTTTAAPTTTTTSTTTSSPTTTTTTTAAPLYYTLNSCDPGDPLYDTTITPILTNQRYVDPISGNFWTWDNAAGTSSPQQTVNSSLQIVSGQSGCS